MHSKKNIVFHISARMYERIQNAMRWNAADGGIDLLQEMTETKKSDH